MGGNESHQEEISEDSSLSSEDEEEAPVTFDNQPNLNSEENICLDSATDTTDAIPPPPTAPVALTMDQVKLIEDQLDVSEKISLIFLLNDNTKVALENSLNVVNGAKDTFIYNWVVIQKFENLNWEEKLLEGVCVIQNFKIIRRLGFDKEILKARFLPHHAFTTVCLNKMRRVLYLLCEDFVKKDIDALLQLIYSDLKKLGIEFKCFPEYLEIYFLYWESVGYIQKDNLTNLSKILKQMDKLDLCDKLSEFIPRSSAPQVTEIKPIITEKRKAAAIFDHILNPLANISQFSSMSSSSMDSPVRGRCYQIDPEKPGICLIINQENFYRETIKTYQHLLPPKDVKLEARTGTKYDKDNLETTFQLFGYKTIISNNLTHDKILTNIEDTMGSMTNESSFICCIMSHGDKGVVYGVNSCKVGIERIKNTICRTNRQNLNGKPKILILQCCQGSTCQKLLPTHDDEDLVTDGPSTNEPVLPLADLCTFYATVPGFGAIRDKSKGSWFIQSLCEKLKTGANRYHFEDICTEVISDVSQKKWNQTETKVGMVPLKHSTFRFKFYLPPMKKTL